MTSMRRRDLAGLLALAPWVVALPVQAKAAPTLSRRDLMGTQVDITVAAGRGTSPAVRAAIDAAWAEMSRLATMMSRYEADSVLSALNRAAGRHAVRVPPEMLQVLQAALAASALTDGAFDVTVGRLTPGPGGLLAGGIPSDQSVAEALRHVRPENLVLDAVRGTAMIVDPMTRVDLGGIAKLPILAAGLTVLTAHGIQGAMVNGGGDVLASARDDGRAWRIGLRDPAHPEQLLAVLPMTAGVVASSGDYERFVLHQGRRYHHIVDPRTGRPTQGVAGVSLVAEHVAAVNGLGAAVMVAGGDRATSLLQRAGVAQALIVDAEGSPWISGALGLRLQPAPGQAAIRGLS